MSLDSEKILASLKAFEEVCGKASWEVRHLTSMRQAIQAADVKVPGELRGAGSSSLVGRRRLTRTLCNRLDELLRLQLEDASRIRDHYMLERELDRLKSREWYVLRGEYPDLYTKALKESTALLRRAQAH
ncbi:MAG TPA: hypothetical protein VEH51_17680 [Burkholderiales bacterium]|nr:hypothetical protein [Burkholderiales bacterium]